MDAKHRHVTDLRIMGGDAVTESADACICGAKITGDHAKLGTLRAVRNNLTGAHERVAANWVTLCPECFVLVCDLLEEIAK